MRSPLWALGSSAHSLESRTPCACIGCAHKQICRHAKEKENNLLLLLNVETFQVKVKTEF